MTGSVAASRSGTSSRSDGPSRSDGSSRSGGLGSGPGTHNAHGAERRREPSEARDAHGTHGTGGASEALSRAREATERGLATAGRHGELTDSLASSGVLRDVCTRVEGPATPFQAHSAEIAPAVYRPGADCAQVWQAQAVEVAPGAAPGVSLPDLGAGLGEAAGVALRRGWPAAAAGVLGQLNDVVEPRRVEVSAAELGLDMSTDEGARAALAIEHVSELSSAGLLARTDKLWPEDRMAGEAAALVELSHPGTHEAALGGDAQAWGRLDGAIAAAVAAQRGGRLVPSQGGWAEGWVETYPELTDTERALGELPGFVPGQLDELGWTEGLGAPDPVLAGPNTTGAPPAAVPGLTDVEGMAPAPEALRGPLVLERYEGEVAVPPGTTEAPGFAERAAELAVEGRNVRPAEGRAGARLEVALDIRLARPDPPDDSFDFVDQSGLKIEIKGALVRTDGGPVTDGMVDGLINSAVKEANQQTAADLIVVDVEGLSDARVEHVRERLQREVTTGRSVIIQR